MKKRLLSLLIVTALFAQAKDKRPEITTEKLISKSSTPVTVIPRIRPGYNPRPMLDVRETVDEWCGTMPAWIEKYGTPRACTYFGATDDPTVRDSFIPTAATDTLIIRLYVHAFADDSGNNPTAELSDAEAQLLTLNEAYSDYTIKFDMTFQIHNDAQYQEISSAEWSSGEIKEAYAADPLQYHNLYVTNSSSDWGILGVSTFPWDSEALTKYGGTIVDKDWFGGPRTFWGTPNISQHTITHELGHALGLWHTHHGVYEVTTCGDCYEGADGYTYDVGDSADVVGDLCSDTKATTKNFSCADPDTFDCQNNDFIDTDFHNFMGYADDDCYDLDNDGFSTQQSGRMHGWITDKYQGLIADSVNKTLLSTSFEDGMPNDWSVIDNDGDGNDWGVGSSSSLDISYYGDKGAYIYYSSVNDDYLVTPKISIPSTFSTVSFSFWARSHSGSYLEDFNVLLSTSDSLASSFTVTLESVIDLPASWTKYTYDLTSYIGQDIFLALQNVSADHWYMFADDFMVTGNANNGPVASNLSFSTDEDTDYSGTLPGSDVDGDALTFAIMDSSVNGTVTLDDSTLGTFTYSPSANFSGSDSVSFSVSDGTEADTGKVSITVNAVNDVPVAADTSYTLDEDGSVGFALSATDAEGDAITYTVESQPSNGTLTEHYSLNFDGSDDYLEIDDGSELSGMSNLSIQVWIKKTSSATGGGIISKWGSGGSNGSNYSYSVYEVDDEDLISFYIKTSSGAQGTNFDSNNLPMNTWHQVFGVYDGSDIKIYLNGTLENSNSNALSGSILSTTDNILIGKDFADNQFDGYIDDIAIWDEALSASEIAALYNSGAQVNAEVNSGDYTSASNLIGYWRLEEGAGTSTVDYTYYGNDGTISGAAWSSDSPVSHTYAPNANYNGSDSFTFTASDGQATSNTATVSFTVNAVNDTPVASDTSLTTDEDTDLTGTLPGSDVDGDALTFAITESSVNGTVTLDDASAGTFTYSPLANFSGSDSVSFSVSDGTAADTGKVSITVNAVNDAPTFTSTAVTSVDEDSEYSYTITTSDLEGDSVFVTAPTIPDWLTLSVNSSHWVSTYAGSADVGGLVDSTLLESRFSYPRGICVTDDGTIYVGDDGNSVLRKISTDGIVSTLAGSGTATYQDGQGTAASFNNLYGMDLDSAGNIYVADYYGRRIRKVTPDGLVTTYAGNGGWGNVDGPAENAEFYQPYDVAVDNQGNVYVSCTHAYTIRKITPDGMVSTIAGIPSQRGLVDGDSTTALLHSPNSIEVDDSGNVYFGDYATLRKITPDGNIVTIAGTGTQGHADGQGTNAQIYRLDGLTYDNSTNILYGTNYWYECIRAIDQDGNVTTIAGNNSTGAMDGDGSVAQFNSPQDLYLWGTSLYISDTANDIIRKVDLPASTLSGTPDNDDVGDHSVSLLATDENGATATQDFTITVNNVNNTPTDFSLLTPVDSSLLILDETNAMSDSVMFSWETSMDPDDSVMYAFHAHHTIYSDGDSAGYLEHDTLMSGTMLYVLYEDILGDITDFMGDSSEVRWDVAAIGGMDTVLSQNGHLHFNVDAHEAVFYGPHDFALLSPDDSLMISITNENLMSDSVVFVWESTSDPDGDTVMYRAKFGHVVYSGSSAIDTIRHDSTLADTSIVVFYEDIYDDISDLGGDNSVIKWNVAAIAGMDTVLSENGPRFVLADATSLSVDEEFIPTEFALHQNYPNPFNPVTTIQYDIPEAGEIRLDVYNILGEKVATLVQGNHHVGRYTIRWDAAGMASGMYFYRISSAKFTATKKLVLMK